MVQGCLEARGPDFRGELQEMDVYLPEYKRARKLSVWRGGSTLHLILCWQCHRYVTMSHETCDVTCIFVWKKQHKSSHQVWFIIDSYRENRSIIEHKTTKGIKRHSLSYRPNFLRALKLIYSLRTKSITRQCNILFRTEE